MRWLLVVGLRRVELEWWSGQAIFGRSGGSEVTSTVLGFHNQGSRGAASRDDFAWFPAVSLLELDANRLANGVCGEWASATVIVTLLGGEAFLPPLDDCLWGDGFGLKMGLGGWESGAQLASHQQFGRGSQTVNGCSSVLQ